MQNPPKQPLIPALKLAKLDRQLPSFELIAQCLEEARKVPLRPIEQPFAVGKPVYTYCLSCLVSPETGPDPTWTLFQGEGTRKESLWTFQTGDAGIIRNLITQECPVDGESNRALQSTSLGPSVAAAAISLTRLQAMDLANNAANTSAGNGGNGGNGGHGHQTEPIGYFKHPGQSMQAVPAMQTQMPAPTAAPPPSPYPSQNQSPFPQPPAAPYGQIPSPSFSNPSSSTTNQVTNLAAQDLPKDQQDQQKKGAPAGGLLGNADMGANRPPVAAWGTTIPPQGAYGEKKSETGAYPAQPRPEIKMSYGGSSSADTIPPIDPYSSQSQYTSQNDSGDHPLTSIVNNFVNPPAYTKRPPTLEGALTDMTPPSLLQSMQIGKMTGVLLVVSNEDMVEVYFEEGAAVHAVAPDSKGEAAVMELLTWDVGKFAFFPNEKSNEKSVRRRMEGMLMESAPLMDQYRYLHEVGLTMNSYVIRRQGPVSEAEFEKRVSSGARMDLQKQKAFYQIVDNKSTLFELLRKMPMPKVEWIPTLYNLICCDLVVPSTSNKGDTLVPPLESLGVDRAPIERALNALKKPETGLMDYPVVWHFIEQEYLRYEHNNSPFCVVLFEMRYRTNNGLELLPPAAIQEAARRIGTVKRNIDIVAHFESPTFILLLPSTQVNAATLLAKRLCDILWDSSLGSALDTRALALAFGVAGHPEENQDLKGLMSAAKDALNQSKRSGSPVVAAKKA